MNFINLKFWLNRQDDDTFQSLQLIPQSHLLGLFTNVSIDNPILLSDMQTYVDCPMPIKNTLLLSKSYKMMLMKWEKIRNQKSILNVGIFSNYNNCFMLNNWKKCCKLNDWKWLLYIFLRGFSLCHIEWTQLHESLLCWSIKTLFVIRRMWIKTILVKSFHLKLIALICFFAENKITRHGFQCSLSNTSLF